MTDINPLLATSGLPSYSKILPSHIALALDTVLADNRLALAQLQKQEPRGTSWEEFALPLDELNARLEEVWGQISHLNAVCNSPEIRTAFEESVVKLSEYSSELGQNKWIFEGYTTLANSESFASFNPARRAIVERTLRDFHLSGIHLPEPEQKRYRELTQSLSELSAQFSNNVMDATQAWSRQILDEAELSGIPDAAKAFMQQCANSKGSEGWLLTLEPPCVQAVVTFADNRALREEIYWANATRASEVGPCAGDFDNSPVMQSILECRKELALLLGFSSYAELSLATKMADSTTQVLTFLRDLASRARDAAEKDLEQLRLFALKSGIETLQTWDQAYYTEKYRLEHYSVSQKKLRRYFPVDHVLTSMFKLASCLFEVTFDECRDFDRWHADVRLFEVREEGTVIGHFYLDLYARPNKRAGAWMNGCRSRRRDAKGNLHTPVAQLVCNFDPSSFGEPALLTHENVLTIFHEFGHGLHHLLTQIDEPGASGINGVVWDAVELPSQFMERWCWQPEVLQMLSSHLETAKPLPKELQDRLIDTRCFQAGLFLLRQLEIALFDFELHALAGHADPLNIMQQVRGEVSVMPPPIYNRFANTFQHVFVGGYAAGYYSYLWADVLAADAFSRFAEEGLFNVDVGLKFKKTVLALGGSQPALSLFEQFRGRAPRIDSLLEFYGLS